ncbi:MAG: ASPIC/UnbV domain-containing protein, partial [Actinomycetota bacterium]|nr:ASPIC/UnbV domain-containing protein [Actinomycetota bacterium]
VLAGSPRPRWAEAGNQEDFLLVQERGRFAPVKDLSLRGPLDGSADAVSTSDYDGDGRVDLFVTNGYLESKGLPQMLRNESVAGNWAGLTLVGDPWNPFGFGAVVTVTTDELRYRRQVTDAFNFKSQSGAGHVHLGLASQRAANVDVRWPDGSRDCITAAAGTHLQIRKGSTGCRLPAAPSERESARP